MVDADDSVTLLHLLESIAYYRAKGGLLTGRDMLLRPVLREQQAAHQRHRALLERVMAEQQWRCHARCYIVPLSSRYIGAAGALLGSGAYVASTRMLLEKLEKAYNDAIHRLAEDQSQHALTVSLRHMQTDIHALADVVTQLEPEELSRIQRSWVRLTGMID